MFVLCGGEVGFSYYRDCRVCVVRLTTQGTMRLPCWPRSKAPSSATPLLPPEAANTEDYSHPASLIQGVRNGHVLLLRGSWLMAQAGYTVEEVEVEESDYEDASDGEEVRRIVRTRTESRYILRGDPAPLPNRQQIEAEHPDAIMPASELERMQQRHESILAAIPQDMVGAHEMHATAVVAVSHCWYHPDHPDGEGKTLAVAAAQLADDLRKMQTLGFEDAAVFFDWASLYQNKPVARTAAQEACFKAALASMSIWYAHRLSTVYIVCSQKGLVLHDEAESGQAAS